MILFFNLTDKILILGNVLKINEWNWNYHFQLTEKNQKQY